MSLAHAAAAADAVTIFASCTTFSICHGRSTASFVIRRLKYERSLIQGLLATVTALQVRIRSPNRNVSLNQTGLVIRKQLSGGLERLQDDVPAEGLAAFEELICPVERIEKSEGSVVDIEPAIKWICINTVVAGNYDF